MTKTKRTSKEFSFEVEYREADQTRYIKGTYRTGRALTFDWVLKQLGMAHPDAHAITVWSADAWTKRG